MRTHVFKLAAPRAFVLSVSGAVLLAGCDPDEPAPVTPTPVATASPAPGSVATGNGNGSPQGATNAGLTSTPTPDRESRDAAPAATRAPAATASVLLQTGNPRRRHRCPGIGERLGATVGEWNRGRRFPARGRLHVGFSTAKGFRRFIGTRRALHLAGRRPHQARVAAERPRLAADLGEHGRRRHCQGGPYGKHCRAAAEA